MKTILRFTESPSVGRLEVDGYHPPPVRSAIAGSPEEGVFPPSEIKHFVRSQISRRKEIIPRSRSYFSFAAYHTSSKEYKDVFDIEYTTTHNIVYDATHLLEEGNIQTEEK